LKYIEGFKKYIAITGFRNVKIEKADNFLKVIRKEKPQEVDIQVFDANFVATWQHLYFAALNALKAFKNGENISRSVEMEIMLYASAQRQIRKALDVIGVKDDTKSIALVVVGENPEVVEYAITIVSKQIVGEQDDMVLELQNDKRKTIQKVFQISEIEINSIVKNTSQEKALTDLVIERVALLATRR
jgi:KEOPS complex subunit Cgi121